MIPIVLTVMPNAANIAREACSRKVWIAARKLFKIKDTRLLRSPCQQEFGANLTFFVQLPIIRRTVLNAAYNTEEDLRQYCGTRCRIRVHDDPAVIGGRVGDITAHGAIIHIGGGVVLLPGQKVTVEVAGFHNRLAVEAELLINSLRDSIFKFTSKPQISDPVEQARISVPAYHVQVTVGCQVITGKAENISLSGLGAVFQQRPLSGADASIEVHTPAGIVSARGFIHYSNDFDPTSQGYYTGISLSFDEENLAVWKRQFDWHLGAA